MKYSTFVVIDIETGKIEYRDRHQWGGMVDQCHSSPTTAETTGYQQTAADKSKQNALVDENEATDSQFDGPAESTPYYRSRLNTAVTSTAKAFNDQRATARLAGNSRGFGYTSPTSAGNDQALSTEESSTLGALPGQALDDTVAQQNNVENRRAGEAGSFGGDASSELSTAANAENQRLARRASMWNSIISGGAAVATGGISSALGPHPNG